MGIDEINWEEPRAKLYFQQRGGSKAGAIQYIADTQPHLQKHLPHHSQYLAPDEDVSSFVQSIHDNNLKVVRGCHPLDVEGMVDVIPTALRVRGKEAIQRAIEEIRADATSDEVRSFMEYESGKPFDGKIGILVQDYHGGERGSIVEHPHAKGIYRIGRISPTLSLSDNEDEEICNERGVALDKMKMLFASSKEPVLARYQTIEKDEVSEVIALYRAFYESGLLPSSHSFQMEYGIEYQSGIRNVLFYQSRLFKKFEEAQEFDVDLNLDNELPHRVVPFDAIGITPPDGLEMQIAELDTDFIQKYATVPAIAYAHNAYGHRKTTELNVQPKNLVGYLLYQHHVLEHGHYRWMQKSKVTLIGVRRSLSREHHSNLSIRIQELQEEIRVRLCSNGIMGSITIVK